ncbi:MAG: TetR/AcrR family transcriptional regulator [Alphaproteobacteria bacterium]|nr:TetR/AcrR family transcriptional regulator [Alphaproteobacteria bacterium]
MGRARTVEDEDILKAARLAFVDRGQLATTREIADAAGISQAVLYQRFGSKDDLFFAAMAPPPPDLEDLLGAPPREPKETEAYLADVAERLYRYFETVAPLFVQLATHTAFHSDHLADAHKPVMGSGLTESLGARLGDLVEKGFIRIGDGSAMARLLISVVHGEALSAALLKTPPDEKRRRETIRLIWRGLKPTDTRDS